MVWYDETDKTYYCDLCDRRHHKKSKIGRRHHNIRTRVSRRWK